VTTVYDFAAATLEGQELPLKAFDGKVLLIVNTASACGFTPQYRQLEELHRALSPRGFSVLGFPCNQFGGQEPGSAQEIAEFCSKNYDVTFPMFGKVEVNGDKALPLFDHLKKQKPGLLGSTAIKWNFTKFLVDRSGSVMARYGSTTTPQALARDIEKLL